MILLSDERLREFENALAELEVKFTEWNPALTPQAWLADVVGVVSEEIGPDA